MSRTLPLLATLCLSAAVLLAPAEPPKQAANPIIHADVPDIAIIRVGDTYYMSSTTMHMSPGLPIMKSKDLVNWQLVGYAYDTLGDNDALTLREREERLRTRLLGQQPALSRRHVLRVDVLQHDRQDARLPTKDIEKGPWKETSFRPSLHDHSLFFDDDGRVYMIYGGGDLRLVELNADLSGLKPGGVNQVIITNASRVAGPNIGLPAEGSQMLQDQRQVLPVQHHLAAGRHAHRDRSPRGQNHRPVRRPRRACRTRASRRAA